jgi:hypothetical protein
MCRDAALSNKLIVSDDHAGLKAAREARFARRRSETDQRIPNTSEVPTTMAAALVSSIQLNEN